MMWAIVQEQGAHERRVDNAKLGIQAQEEVGEAKALLRKTNLDTELRRA